MSETPYKNSELAKGFDHAVYGPALPRNTNVDQHDQNLAAEQNHANDLKRKDEKNPEIKAHIAQILG